MDITAIGIAAFYVDSFGPRGIKDTVTDQSQLPPAANVADALAALRLLATHPRIDPQRIGVMGFSRGGGVSIYTALEPVARRHRGGSAVRGPCPILPALQHALHLGEHHRCADPVHAAGSDDYTPSRLCDRYMDWFRAKGAAADSIVYEDAQHGFDGIARVQFINSIQTGRDCGARYDLDRGVLYRLDTNEPCARASR